MPLLWHPCRAIPKPRTKTAAALLAILACAATVAVVVVGITQLPGDSAGTGNAKSLTAARTRALLAGSPQALASLHEQGGRLLEGGITAFQARLGALKGYPIVINKWASWCVPCKREFAAFQHASVEYGRRVAFIGIDSADSSRTDAVSFLRSFPVSYPSYYDPGDALGERVTDSAFTPVTVFVARDGSRYIHQGEYPSLGKLEQDVIRYALDA